MLGRWIKFSQETVCYLIKSDFVFLEYTSIPKLVILTSKLFVNINECM